MLQIILTYNVELISALIFSASLFAAFMAEGRMLQDQQEKPQSPQ